MEVKQKRREGIMEWWKVGMMGEMPPRLSFDKLFAPEARPRFQGLKSPDRNSFTSEHRKDATPLLPILFFPLSLNYP
jgi:hypothetical protein